MTKIEINAPNGTKLSLPDGLFIGGEWKTPRGGEQSRIPVVYPATGEKICDVAVGSSADVDDAVQAAEAALAKDWGLKSTPAKRGELMSKWADLIEKNAKELSILEAIDNGKPRWMAEQIDLADSVACLRFYAGLADKVEGKTMELDVTTKFAHTRVEPIGVCGAIIPWNYPVQMACWKLGPALAAGNCLILKPAEQTPLSALRLAELAQEAGYPAGALQVINGLGSEVGAAIASHKRIRKVAFTGSTVTGRKIMAMAASSNLKKVTLELGGKSPVLVFDDVDVEFAVPWVAMAILFNMGQDCCAGSRLYIQRGVHDAFVAKLTEAFKAVKIGDPFDDTTSHGAQVSEEQYRKILAYIAHGKDEGATLVCGGADSSSIQGVPKSGYWVEPTIFTHARKGMRIVDEEIFGPVLAVIPFDTEEEAIAMANDSEYGLGAGVFSENGARCLRVSSAIQAGTVFINNYALLSNAVPFGGYKQSGHGRELGVDAVKEWTEVKAVHWNIGEKLEWPLRAA
ncbi:aldehyde dehydrogenase [Jaminaea rosea]|uniref:Aldehyde dehydrogenase n=1 Tax=Jaminaea rosea TaxID=1569628 RepID=A0A316UXP7_9BASI|nr:aldehyde dehydrogenase [Jaminaea rosea]PWN28673.1 aldehyde dehydrogenase [Jaminaea rosea]